MRYKEFSKYITEIDRRGFLRGLGAAGTAAALGSLPSIAKANNVTVQLTPQEWDSLVWKYKQSWKPNIKLPTPLPAYQQHATITVKVDSSGKVINKTLTQSSGNQDIDNAVLSATGDSIPQELSNRLNLAAGQTTQFFFRSRGIIPDPGAQSQDNKTNTQQSSPTSNIGKAQKAADIILKQVPGATISQINVLDLGSLIGGTNQSSGMLIEGHGDFGNGNTYFIMSEQGIKTGLLGQFMDNIKGLGTPWNPIIGGKSLEAHWRFDRNKVDVINYSFDNKTKKVVADASTKEPETSLSEFSIKGLHFGMTKQEVDQIKSRNNMGGGLTGIFSGGEVVNFGSLLGVTSKPNEYSKEFGKEMSFQGMPGYLNYKGGKLVAITLINKSQVINELLEKMLDRFPGGSVQETIWQNRMGNSFPNKEYRWKEVQGASIWGKVRDREVNVGVITFADSRDIQNSISQSQQRQKKDQKDF